MSESGAFEDPTAELSEPRNYSGWASIGSLVLLLMFLTWYSSARAKPDRLEGYEEEQATLKRVLSAESLIKGVPAPIGNSNKSTHDTLAQSLDEPISGLVLDADKNPMAAMLYAEMRTYQKQPVPVEHLALLKNSALPEDRAFFKIYTSDKLTRQQADTLIAKLPHEPFVYEAARVQALEKSGDKGAIGRLVSPSAVIGFGILMLAVWPFLGISFAIWLIYSRKSREGKLAPLGMPLESISVHDADRLAIRAAQIFAAFLIIQLIAEVICVRANLRFTEGQVGAATGLLTIVAVFVLQRLPIDGKFILLDYLGFRLSNLGRDVWLGVLGFIAEFPVAMMLAELSTALLHWLPKGTHPATEQLSKNHDLQTLVPILIAGSIVAPFWEEIVFRGLLFPGLRRLFGGIGPGVLLSSLLFACVHSQGITLWLPLAFVGASSCFLQAQSRSLVPGMVMHSLHNTAIFVIILLT